jgi:urease beta subunit
MIPGEIIVRNETITLNAGKKTKAIIVLNEGDRPVQVGSHYHFYEVNRSLRFDRKQAYGYRPDIPSGTCIRIEPGQQKEVTLVKFGGNRRIYGFNNLTDGQVQQVIGEAEHRAKLKGFE